MPRDHVATRGDPDHDRGVCFLTTPERCLVPLLSLHRLVPTSQPHIHVWVDPCHLRHSLVRPRVLFYFIGSDTRTRSELTLKDLVFPFTSLTLLG
jgi:hypothetical protein